MSDTVVDIAVREVMDKVGNELGAVQVRAEQILADVTARIEAEARARVDSVIENLPSEKVFGELAGTAYSEAFDTVELDGWNPVEWIKAQAASRAWRTLAQGLISAVLIAFATAVIQAVFVPGFDILSLSDWKPALVLGVGAAGTAFVSYAQNKLGIKPPKVG